MPTAVQTSICKYTATKDTIVSLAGWTSTTGNSTGSRMVQIDAAGKTVFLGGAPAGMNTVGFCVVAFLSTGECIEIKATQNSGNDLEVTVYTNSNVIFSES